MSQKHLLIIDPLAKLNFELDSSLRLGFELIKNGNKVFVAEIGQLSWDIEDTSAAALASEITYKNDQISSIEIGNSDKILLEDFHGIHMRKEPPVHGEFIASTWLLGSVKGKTWIFNDPQALQSINEKLSIFNFPNYADNALVSANADELLQFVKNKCKGDSIIKPLDGFGGKGIFRLNLEETSEKDAKLIFEKETDSGQAFRLVQPFNSNIFQGEIRAFAVGGNTVGWCLKKPKEGNYMANTSQGATLNSYTPTKEIEEMIRKTNRELLKMGIYFVGYDIIGSYISEINITSPRLLVGSGDTHNYYRDIAQWVEKHCEEPPSL